MLYEAILLGCQKYHQATYSYDNAYKNYRNDRDGDKWSKPSTLDYGEVNRLILFVNQWRCMMPRKAHDNVERVREGFKRQIPELNRLEDCTLLNVELDKATCELIERSFDVVANAGHRFESVATSKMLHAAINPDFFVMWDGRIMSGYGLYGSGREYAHCFLPEMKKLAKSAISQVMERENCSCADAIESLTSCGHTLAKVLDEYNYVKFTLQDREVQRLEEL